MTWLKIDDGFVDHPKVCGLSHAAFHLHVAALCYCARHLTDGLIPAVIAVRLLHGITARHREELVNAGLWVPVDDGWKVHNFLEFNPSRAKVEDERAQSAERQRKHRESRRDNPVSNGPVTRSRPDPTRTTGSSLTEGGAVDKSENERAGVMEAKAVISDAKSSLTRIHPRRAS